MNSRRLRLMEARLYLVCDEIEPALLQSALRGGVDMVQLRMKSASEAAILAAAAWIGPLCAQHDALFLINDRPDLVVRAGAHGVHLGQDDEPVHRARARLGSEPLIGLSTHSPAQVDAAAGSGADYIGTGPVHATPTKPGRAEVGLELVRYAAVHARVPFFAIGGIEPGNAPAVVAAGARRIAVVRALTQAAEPESAARTLRAMLEPAEQREEVQVGAAQS